MFFCKESDTSNWHVVLKAPQRGFYNQESFDEDTYLTISPLDISQLDITIDESENHARKDCKDIIVEK